MIIAVCIGILFACSDFITKEYMNILYGMSLIAGGQYAFEIIKRKSSAF